MADPTRQLPHWRRWAVVAGLALAAFTFNTTENLPIGLLRLMSDDLDVSLSSVGLLVTGYGLTVAVVSVPIAHAMRRIPRRHLMAVTIGVLAVATAITVAASAYPVLLIARIATALAQAAFWAIVGPVAVGLFPREIRGRVVGVMFAGGSLASVLGVPAGTWLGQQEGWRAAFVALTALSVLAWLVVVSMLPTARPSQGSAAAGETPDRRAFGLVLVTTALAVTGAFAAFTYVVPYLTDVVGLSDDAVSAVLLAFGVGGILGVLGNGLLSDRRPRLAILLPVGGQAVALLGLYAAAGTAWLAVALLFLLGLSVAPVFSATQTRVLDIAPGTVEVASASNSAAFNVGIAVGAWSGGLMLALSGVRETFLFGAGLSAFAFGVASRLRVAA